MSTTTVERTPLAADVTFTSDEMTVALVDGRRLSVPLAWFPPAGARVLGVACGGGQQGPVLVASGYEVSIMDLSDRQLGAERLVAAREGYRIDTVKADMTVSFPFASASFDLVVNPVSNSYIEELDNLWRESFRVLKPGGALMTGWANPLLYLFEDAPFEQEGLDFVCKFALPYNGRKMAEAGMEGPAGEPAAPEPD